MKHKNIYNLDTVKISQILDANKYVFEVLNTTDIVLNSNSVIILIKVDKDNISFHHKTPGLFTFLFCLVFSLLLGMLSVILGLSQEEFRRNITDPKGGPFLIGVTLGIEVVAANQLYRFRPRVIKERRRITNILLSQQ